LTCGEVHEVSGVL